VLNELRRRSRRPRVEADPDGTQLVSAPAPGPGPVEEAWRAHRRMIVREAVEALPPIQRQALSLAFLEDLTHEQVASFLNLPLGTAKTRIRAGLQALRARLSPILATSLMLVAAIMIFHFRNQSVRDSDALRMVTSSDVVPLRLSAGAGVPAEAHGQFRGRPGAQIAVLTVSHLEPPAAGYTYHAWGKFDGRWISLGIIRPNKEGRDLLVCEGPHLGNPPTALQVTAEPTSVPRAPTSAAVMAWPNP
jgi:RNA polymerase sigma-70 factor (ECF subfamily)